MSAQEREALVEALGRLPVRVLVPNIGTVTGFLRSGSIVHLIDLIASDLRPVPAAGEAATEDVIERVRVELDRHEWDDVDDMGVPWGCSCGARIPNDDAGNEWMQDHRARALAGLLAGGVPGRSEGEWTQRIEGEWLISTTDRCTCSPHYGAHERHCGAEPELDLSTLPGWRSEAEIKAEALREAAEAVRRAKEPGHWNLRDPFDPDVAHSPDVWLERRAVQVTDTEGSKP